VLLDGLRVADPQTGQVDLSLIPSVIIQSIDVMQGATSARYGSGSLGGTVRLRTLRAQDSLFVRTSAEAGAFGERSASAVTTGSVGSWRALASGRLATEDGDFAYTNEALVPAQTVRREGAGLTTRTAYARISAPSDGRIPGDWSLSGWHTAADRGLPGPGNAPSSGATQDTKISRLWLTGDLNVGASLLQVSGQYTRGSSRYRNPATGNQTETVSHSAELSTTNTWSISQRGDGIIRTWLHDGWVETGVSGRLDAASINADAQQWTTAAFAEAGLGTRWLRLFPAARLDVISLQNAEISAPSFPVPERGDPSTTTVTVNPRLGAELRPFKQSNIRLTGRISRAFRAPTFTERFYQPGGNAALDNESGWSTEAGLRFQRSRSRFLAIVQVNAFRTVIRDQIVWAPSYVDTGVQVWSPSNIESVHTRGIELSGMGEIRLADEVSLGGGTLFTVTEAENRANPNAASFGAQLPYVPRQQAKVWVNAEVHRFDAGIAAQAVSERFYSADETQSTSPYQVARAHVSYTQPVGDASLTFRLDLDNAFDQDYAIVRLYPMPPRHLSARLILNLSP
jgi:iron complex outermembrane receptor protein